MWKGKPHEKYAVPLLAMLLVECGSLTAECRGDWKSGGYYAFGISQHHICLRRTFGKNYCFWQDGKHPQKQVEEEHPEFASSWESQFYHYSDVIRLYIEEGLTADQMIKRWNPGEIGRREKVRWREEFVSLSIYK